MRQLTRVPVMQWARLFLCVATVVLAFMVQAFVVVLPWALLVAALDLLAWRTIPALSWREPLRRRHIRRGWQLFGVETIAAALGIGFHGSVLGLLVIVPLVHAGAVRGRRMSYRLGMVAMGTAALAALAVGNLTQNLVTSMLLWVALGVLGGLLAAGPREVHVPELVDDLPPSTSREPALAAEASSLVRRLHQLADSLSTGFDAPAAAEMALQDLSAQTRTTRSAVLVGAGNDPAVPLAMRGADRAPWPDPTSPESILHTVWASQQPLLTEWIDLGVRRSLLAVPLPDARGQRLGIMVADRPANIPFNPGDLICAQRVARDHAPTVDLAMAFASLRELAGLEERQRLAREMHDGIAQEVVALGFGLDGVRRAAHKAESPLEPQLDSLREDLSRVLGDLRVHIADLRIAVRPDTGLGAMMGGRLQTFGTNQGISTRMQLSETGFRLPAHTEVLLYRLFLQVLNDAQHARGVTGIDLSLSVAAPRAEFHITHDGSTSLDQIDFHNHPLVDLGAQITVETPPTGGVMVRLRIRARGLGHADLTHERIPQLS